MPEIRAETFWHQFYIIFFHVTSLSMFVKAANSDYLDGDQFSFLKDCTILLMCFMTMKSNSNHIDEVCQVELIAKIKISAKLMAYMKIHLWKIFDVN